VPGPIMIIGTLLSAGSLKLDVLTKIGAQLQSWLFSNGTEFWTSNQMVSFVLKWRKINSEDYGYLKEPGIVIKSGQALIIKILFNHGIDFLCQIQADTCT